MTPIRSFSHFSVQLTKKLLIETTFLLFFNSEALYQLFITLPHIIKTLGQFLVKTDCYPFVHLKLVANAFAVHYVSPDTLPSREK